MDKVKKPIFKIVMSVLFSALVLSAYLYVCIKGDLDRPYLSYGCIIACFLLSLLFIGKSSKKIFITLALAANVAADYFLVFDATEENKIIGVSIFLGVQFFYLLYSLSLTKAIGLKIMDIALRVALCLIVYFVVPKYVTLSTLEMLSLMYIANSFVTLLSILVHIKTEWVTFIGFLLFFVCDIFVGLTNGGADILNISGSFVDFIFKYDIAFYTYIPGVLLISLSSVWAKASKWGKIKS